MKKTSSGATTQGDLLKPPTKSRRLVSPSKSAGYVGNSGGNVNGNGRHHDAPSPMPSPPSSLKDQSFTQEMKDSGKKYVEAYLSFNISENPSWKGKEVPNEEMIEYVVQKINETKNGQLSLDDTIIQQLIDEFIIIMCHNEDSGVKTLPDLEKLKDDNNASETHTLPQKEAIGMIQSMREVKTYYQDMNSEIPFITSETLIHLHKILMTQADPDRAGIFSDKNRMTMVSGKKKYYPKKEIVEENIDHLWDIINEISCYFFASTTSGITEQVFYKFILFLAWSFHCIVSLHPFSDGNGRVSRLAFYFLHHCVSPLPVAIYNVYSPTNKADYIDALEQGRTQNRDGEMFNMNAEPSELAAMILSCEYHTWKKYEELFDEKKISQKVN